MYPIIVSPTLGGRLVKFPDFPGCSVSCTFESPVVPFDLVETKVREYLIEWITTMLKQHRAIPQPYTYAAPVLKNLESKTTIDLPKNLQLALRFHWLRIALQVDFSGMENFVGIPAKRYQELEQSQVPPTERELAILNHAEEIVRQETPNVEQQAATR